jgi:hypothetical protein
MPTSNRSKRRSSPIVSLPEEAVKKTGERETADEEKSSSPLSTVIFASVVSVIIAVITYHNAFDGRMVFDDTNAIIEVRLEEGKRWKGQGRREAVITFPFL